MTTAELVRLTNVTCSYGSEVALEHVDLTVRKSDLIGIVGPSGSGKSTLLKTITGAVSPAGGTIEWARGRKGVGYVPQIETINWFFPITVREAINMAQSGRGPWMSSRDRAEADEVLGRLEIAHLSDRHIRQLSGGQQQRVFLARALVGSPDLLLLDEPTSGIDVRTRHEVMHVLHDLHHEGLAIVFTTHDLNGVAAHLPDLVCLNREVVARGAPREVLTSAVLERTYGAPMEVLVHGGMPVVVESAFDDSALDWEREHHEHPL